MNNFADPTILQLTLFNSGWETQNSMTVLPDNFFRSISITISRNLEKYKIVIVALDKIERPVFKMNKPREL